jgi:hypothetical protein
MTTRLFALSLTVLSLLPVVPQDPPAFDPVGTWQISTMSEGGAPMAVSVTIGGRPGAFTGRAVTPQATLPLQEVATTPTGMIAIFNWAPRGVVLVKVDRAANGGHTGTWAGIEQVYPLTARRGQQGR